MGVALAARGAARRGADVTLVAANLAVAAARRASRSCRRRPPPTSRARRSRGRTRTSSSWPRPSPTTGPPNRRTASARRTRTRGRSTLEPTDDVLAELGAPQAQRPGARRLRGGRGRGRARARARRSSTTRTGTFSSTTTYLVPTSGSSRTETRSSLISPAGERRVEQAKQGGMRRGYPRRGRGLLRGAVDGRASRREPKPGVEASERGDAAPSGSSPTSRRVMHAPDETLRVLRSSAFSPRGT